MTFRAPIYTRIAPRPRPAELLTWIETLPPGEIARTIPLRQADWPAPTLRRSNPELRTWLESLPPGEISRTIPLRQSDWPNPVRRVSNPSLYSVAYSQQIQPAATRPFGQSDWPNPVRRVSSPSLYSVTCWQQLQPVVVAASPFAQTDWPNPQQSKQNLELRTWVNQTPWPLTVGAPFAQDDWPNPVRRIGSRELRTWAESLNVASIGAPFSQTDWPNPIRRLDSVSLRICVNAVQLQPQPLPPQVTGIIPDIFQRQDTGTFPYDLSVYFTGATSYSIAPAIEAGWTFDTGTAVLVIDTDAIGVFGPFTVTATNATGSTPSNAFDVEVAAAQNSGAGRRARRRRRLFVEIDGQDFEVESIGQAQALLDRAKEVAVKQIAAERAAPARVEHGIKRPSIRTDSDELRPLVRQKRAEIVALYDALLRDLEIQYLLAKADEEDEEETLIRFLM